MRRTVGSVVWILVLAIGFCPAALVHPGGRKIPLSKRPAALKTDLAAALSSPKVAGSFSGKPVSLSSLSVLLWSAAGVAKPAGKKQVAGLDSATGATLNRDRRTVAFPYNTDSVDLYLIREANACRYDAKTHSLVVVTNGDYRSRAGIKSRGFSALVVLVADLQRYPVHVPGQERLFSAHTVCGAVMQNIALACDYLRLGSHPFSDFNQSEIIGVLKLPPHQAALYVVAVGHPSR